MMPARKAQQGGVLLSELLAGIATVVADDDRAVQGVAQDSRQVQPG
jgi:hypothetical protein